MIQEFCFSDKGSDWHIERASLLPLNLLVGISGVGKSRILRALRSVSRAGAGIGPPPPQCTWELQVLAGDETYRWTASTAERDDERRDDELFMEPEAFFELHRRRLETRFLEERITLSDTTVVASRKGNDVFFGGQAAPRLKETESLISLFQKETALAPLHRALSFVFASSRTEFEYPLWQRHIQKWRREITSLEQLRDAVHVPLIARFDILQSIASDVYAEVVDSFKEIFETVTNVRVGLARELQLESSDDDDGQMLTIVIDEEGIPKPVVLSEASSGMQRTLRHLVELALAPEGSTVLIDEYENSLGVNCLPSVTEHLVKRMRRLQIIATSHHPYVINKIDLKYWRIVTRRGGRVRICNATDIPELGSASRQEAFVRLMNSKAYRDGVLNHD